MRGQQRAAEGAGTVQAAADDRAISDSEHDLVAASVAERFRAQAQRDLEGGRTDPCLLGRRRGAKRADHRARQRYALRLRLVALAAWLEEAHFGSQHRVRRSVQHAAQLEMVEGARQLGCVSRRINDAERGWRRVLGRSRRVRVQRVTLVEQRVDQPLECRIAVTHHSPR